MQAPGLQAASGVTGAVPAALCSFADPLHG